MRTLDRFLTLLLGLAGLAFGVLVVVEVVTAALDRPALVLPYSQTATFLRDHPWSAGVVVAIAVGLLVLGLALLVAELKPRRRTQLVLEPRDPRVTTTLSTRSVARVLENAAGQTPGISGAKATVRRRRARLRVTTALREAGDITARAEADARAALAALQLRRTPKLVVRAREDKS